MPINTNNYNMSGMAKGASTPRNKKTSIKIVMLFNVVCGPQTKFNADIGLQKRK